LFIFNFQQKHNQNPLAVLNDCLGKLPKGLQDEEAIGRAFLTVFSFKFMVDVLICALESGAEVEGNAETFEKVQVCQWVDDAGGIAFLGEVMGMMFDALPKGKQTDTPTTTAKKKK
jgi:hypothetical protein